MHLFRLVRNRSCPCNVAVDYGRSIRMSSSSSDVSGYQFLQRSKTPTFHFQPGLPRLPIPKLEKSLQRYLAAIEPLVTPQEMDRTRHVAVQFEHGKGKELHGELVAKDKQNNHTSFISKPWFDMYLKSRTPLVINYNPFLTFKMDDRPEYNDQVIRSTNMLISSLRFMRSLRAEVLEPEVFHLNPSKSDTPLFRTVTRLLPSRLSWYGAYYFNAFPLDMSQYSGLFNGTRIPGLSADRLLRDPTAKHMLVISNGRFYVFDALDRDGNLLAPSTYHAILDHIVKRRDPPPSYSIGYLPTTDRDSWAAARAHLEESGNGDSLRAIDTAIFSLVLDDTHFGGDFVKGSSTMLHGPAYNRWCDKSLQLLTSRDGVAWINFEHAWGDGVAVLRFFNDIFNDSTKRPRIHPGSIPSTGVDPSALVRELEFHLDDRSRSEVEEAKKRYEATTSSLSVDATLTCLDGTNRDYLKKQKLSPDAILQLALQMAYFREHGRTCSTYESCSTAAFKHGRTETVRAASMQTQRFTRQALSKSPPSPAELRAGIEECSKYHSQLTKEAAMGQGFDRHLFAMKELALARGEPVPELYQDPVYQKTTTYHLSTSTLSGGSFLGGGFGPVVEDGYGVAYGYTDPLNVGTFVSCYQKHHQASNFLSAIVESLKTIASILHATESKNS